MDSFFVKYKKIIVLLIFLLLPLVLMTTQAKRDKEPGLIENIAVYIISPIQRIVTYSTRGLQEIWSGYINLVGIRKENQRLKKEIQILKEDNNKINEAVLANKRLRELLAFKESVQTSMIPAQVISKDATNWFKMVMIDKGRDNGIVKNMPVVTHGGIVGRVIEVFANSSKVQLIIDYNSAVDVLVQRSRDGGVVGGIFKNRCEMRFLDRRAKIEVGDIIVSSGLDGVFPKGLVVGKVVEIRKKNYGLFQEVEIMPSVDFSRLEEVLIISGTELVNGE